MSYDSNTDAWRPLPNPPSDLDVGGEGVIGRSHALFTDADGVVLDWVSGEWLTLPRLPDASDRSETSPFNRTVVTAGTNLFVFGGEQWRDSTGVVLSAGYVWRGR